MLFGRLGEVSYEYAGFVVDDRCNSLSVLYVSSTSLLLAVVRASIQYLMRESSTHNTLSYACNKFALAAAYQPEERTLNLALQAKVQLGRWERPASTPHRRPTVVCVEECSRSSRY